MSLELRGFSALIGRRTIVHGVDLAAAEGEVLALLGRNGAGKTTLVRALAGLLPARGAAVLDGEDIALLPPGPRSRRLGYMAQELGAPSVRLSVLELLLLAQNSGRVAWQLAGGSLGRAQEMLAMLRLERFAGKPAGELSGGERQMVLLALALVRRPRLLLLDEPTSALDLANQLHLLQVLTDYTRRERIVTVAILHDLSLAARFADRVVMLRDGRVAHSGPTGAVMTEPVVRDMFGVDCRLVDVPGSPHRALYPLAPLRGFGEG